MMIHICIKQDLSNIWSLIYEQVKQRWGFKKSVYYFKRVIKRVTLHVFNF